MPENPTATSRAPPIRVLKRDFYHVGAHSVARRRHNYRDWGTRGPGRQLRLAARCARNCALPQCAARDARLPPLTALFPMCRLIGVITEEGVSAQSFEQVVAAQCILTCHAVSPMPLTHPEGADADERLRFVTESVSLHTREVVGSIPTAPTNLSLRPHLLLNTSLVAHLVRDEGVAGSNPATPTK
jgi:hypothetical protein